MYRLILNYTLRSLRRNLFYHSINAFGLTIAFASVFYILIWINQERSYDKYHPDSERLYRFSLEFQRGDHHSHFARTWKTWTREMPAYFPEIETMNRLQSMRDARFMIGTEKFRNTRFFLTDSNYFSFFGNRLLEGNPGTVLNEPRTMVISEDLATSHFVNENPIGKEIRAAHQFDTAYHSFRVTGIMENPRQNSHFKAEILSSVDYSAEDPGWAYVYFRLKEGASPDDMLAKFPEFLRLHMDEANIAELTPHLQPVTDIHLKSDKDREIEANNKERILYYFAALGAIFLLIVFVNNANLQIAMINGKMRFIFLNRVNGAGIRDIARFVGWETASVYLMSILAAVIVIVLSSKGFNRYFGYPLQVVTAGVWLQLVLLAVGLTVIGVFLGLFPVLMLGVRERVYFLSGRVFYQTGFSLLQKRKGTAGRKLMMILQFSGSALLVLVTLFVYLQIRFMLNAGIGSGQNDLIVLPNLPRPALDNYATFKSVLQENALIRDVSASMEEPSSMLMDAMKYNMEGMDESMKDDFIGVFPVDDNFLEFYDIPLLAGRNFPAYGGMEAREYFIINEAALERLKLENPEDAIGRPFELIFGWPEIFRGGEIIGVSENFHFYTLKEEIKPMVMFQKHIWFWNFLVRLNRSEIPAALDYIREKWDELYPDYPFEYRFVDDLYRDLYRHEIRQARILGVLSVLTVIIACLGLVGLMHYLAGIRTREIGIRKVNGARPVNILILLNREFIQLILLSLVIGIPLAIYLLDQWLRNFVYRIDIQWWIPVLTGLGFMLISLLTVTYQSWAAAARNPVASLRYE